MTPKVLVHLEAVLMLWQEHWLGVWRGCTCACSDWLKGGTNNGRTGPHLATFLHWMGS
jgi:hypothetical protein